MTTTWRIELLGKLEARKGDLILTHFGTRKVGALLTYLAYYPDQGHSREILAELLWPDEDTETTRDRFRQALSNLRRLLEPEGVASGSVLAADRAEVRLMPQSITTDVAEFEAALAGAANADTAEARGALLAHALERYQGALLPGFYEEWIAPERERLAELYRTSLSRLAAVLFQQGDLQGALEMARRALLADPLQEESHTDLMRLYATAGRFSDAVRQYRELERVLKEQLGSVPSATAHTLFAQLRNGVAPPLTPEYPREEGRGKREEGEETGRVGEGEKGRGERLPEHPNTRIPEHLNTRIPALALVPLESEGGAVPLDSTFYLVRPTDAEFEAAITRKDSIVLVKGARQMGKTSLLARGLQRAREAGSRVILTDIQKFTAAQLESADTLFFNLAEQIADQLELDIALDALWDVPRGWNVKFERFLRREVLGKTEAHIVWGLDEVDRLFGQPFSADVFGLFRSWHNERSLDPSGPWSRFTLAISYATEAHLFITDLNQSPFNVGTRIALDDFNEAEVAEANRRYASPLKDASEVARYYRLVGGNPYLVRRGLHAMTTQALDIARFEAEATQENGVFGDALRRMVTALGHDPALCEGVRGLLQGRPLSDPDSFYRLRSAGILLGSSEQDAQIRCRLYRDYLRRYLQ